MATSITQHGRNLTMIAEIFLTRLRTMVALSEQSVRQERSARFVPIKLPGR